MNAGTKIKQTFLLILSAIRSFSQKHRFPLLVCAWIGLCLTSGALLWFSTGSLRTNLLVRQANLAIARSGESRRLGLVLGRAAGFGTWFSLVEVPGNSAAGGRVLVFTLMNGTQAASCAAFMDESEDFEKIIPLSDYAERVLEELPDPLFRFYEERIVTAAREAEIMGLFEAGPGGR